MYLCLSKCVLRTDKSKTGKNSFANTEFEPQGVEMNGGSAGPEWLIALCTSRVLCSVWCVTSCWASYCRRANVFRAECDPRWAVTSCLPPLNSVLIKKHERLILAGWKDQLVTGLQIKFWGDFFFFSFFFFLLSGFTGLWYTLMPLTRSWAESSHHL